MEKRAVTVKCDSCAVTVKWSGLPGPFDLDAALDALGWTSFNDGRAHRCADCTERATWLGQTPMPDIMSELEALRDLDLDSFFGGR